MKRTGKLHKVQRENRDSSKRKPRGKDKTRSKTKNLLKSLATFSKIIIDDRRK